MLKTEEKCDGDDNDDNGFVDDGLYWPFGVAVPAPEAPPSLTAFAFDGSRYLEAWLATSGVDAVVRGRLLDLQFQPIGQVVELARIPRAGTDVVLLQVAATARPGGGFVVAYSAPSGAAFQLFAVSVDGGGGASELAPIAGTIGKTNRLFAAFDAAGPLLLAHAAFVVCISEPCPPRISTARPGGTIEPLPGSERASLRTFRVEGSTPVVAAWAECPPETQEAAGSGELSCKLLSSAVKPRVRIQVIGGVSGIIENADAIAVARPEGGPLFAIWNDLTDDAAPRLLAASLDQALRPSEKRWVVSTAVAPFGLALAARGREVLSSWGHLKPGSDEIVFQERRIDIDLGPFEAMREIPGATGVRQLLATASGYLAIGEVGDVGILSELRCAETAPSTGDGGALDAGMPDAGIPDGGAPDGGAHDAGPPDGGLLGSPCAAQEADPSTAVSGEIRWADGVPISGQVVVLQGCSVLTDSSGTFRASGVPAPFDLTILDLGQQRSAFSYLDVASRQLTIVVPRVDLPLVDANQTQVQVSSAGFAGSKLSFLYYPGGAKGFVGSGALETLLIDLRWFGSNPSTGHLVYLEQNAGGEFQALQLVQDLVMEAQATLDLGTLVPGPISSILVAGTPPVADSREVRLLLEVAGEAAAVDMSSGSGSFSLDGPLLPAGFPGKVYLDAFLSFDTGGPSKRSAWITSSYLANESALVTLTAPPQAIPVTPAAGATGVGVLPTFEISGADGASGYVLEISGGTLGRLFVYSATPPTRIPNLDQTGRGLSPGVQHSWRAGALFGISFGELVSGARSVVPWLRLGRLLPGQSSANTERFSFTP